MLPAGWNDVILTVRIHLLTAAEGGRPTPVSYGYRPLCVISAPDGSEIYLGLCQLEVADSIPPGGAATARLRFVPDDEVEDIIREHLRPGATFKFAEGHRVIGEAAVLDSSLV